MSIRTITFPTTVPADVPASLVLTALSVDGVSVPGVTFPASFTTAGDGVFSITFGAVTGAAHYDYTATATFSDGSTSSFSGTFEGEAGDYPVTAQEAFIHCRLADFAQEETTLNRLIAAATEHAETAMACTLMARNRSTMFYDDIDPMYLTNGPLISVQSITDDDEKTITDYRTRRVGKVDRLIINEGFKYPITVVYRAGYATAAAVPASIRQAILMHVATMYENRESIAEKGRTVVPHSLADFYRLHNRGPLVG